MKTLIIILGFVTMLQSAVINNSQRKISDEEILSKWFAFKQENSINFNLKI